MGDLHSVDIGPRSKLWSEKEFLDRGAWEFADTEKFIKTAEDLVQEPRLILDISLHLGTI